MYAVLGGMIGIVIQVFVPEGRTYWLLGAVSATAAGVADVVASVERDCARFGWSGCIGYWRGPLRVGKEE